MCTDLPLHEALLTRMETPSRLADRRSYIGASEVGNCLRRVVASKLTPETLDASSMGRMLAGRVMENEVVQLVRIALNGRLRNTGRNQLDVVHPELPFHAHPDGRIVSDGPDEGDGILEVKTASTAVFKRYQSEGLPQSYLDQVQAQMGLSGLGWGLVVLVSRETLAELATFKVSFDSHHFERLIERARIAAEGFSSAELPAGEPDRGYCYNCAYAKDCPQLQAQRKAAATGELPEVTRLELDCEVEELAAVESDLDPLQKRATELRERIRETLQALEVKRAVLDGATVQLVSNSRTSFDSKALQRESPDLFQRFQKTSCFTNLRITFKGEPACLPTAS